MDGTRRSAHNNPTKNNQMEEHFSQGSNYYSCSPPQKDVLMIALLMLSGGKFTHRLDRQKGKAQKGYTKERPQKETLGFLGPPAINMQSLKKNMDYMK